MININFQTKTTPKLKSLIQETTFLILNSIPDFNDKDISLTIVNENFIKNLNSTYRQKNEATDVLTFIIDDQILGDIYICLEKIQEKANLFKVDYLYQIKKTIAHAFCHLLGFTHENEEKLAIMHHKENQLLNL